MKNYFLITLILMTALTVIAEKRDIGVSEPGKPSITFTENKGQVSDQNFKPRPDVLFSGSMNGMTYHLRNNGISYQFYQVNSWKEIKDPKFREVRKIRSQTTIYRLDMNWLNGNAHALIQTDKALEGYTNYYLEVCPKGVNNVKTYTGVTYKNIYENIDLHYYEEGGNLKYDFLVGPYADYKNIQLNIEGAENIVLKSDGSALIHTLLGDIEEGAPLVFQNGKQIGARWTKKGNVLSFDIERYDRSLPLIIDPLIRSWGTWYGGTQEEHTFGCAADGLGNVYMTGDAESSTGIATSGSHQSVKGGAIDDGFLAKFNSSGIRLWCTYYGGIDVEWPYGCAVDVSGNVYMAGSTGTNSLGVISTPGSHQPVIGGNMPSGFTSADAFLVKFNSNGVRIWGTYYGGASSDFGYDVCTDNSGNVYLYGITETMGAGTVIATPGSHQPSNNGGNWGDAFLVKFDGAGVRQWGTYYGGTGNEGLWSCITDANGNVYISGFSQSATSIATSSGHQAIYGGGVSDAFLVKFNTSGVRQWGTYYGGSGYEYGYDCATDASGDVYLTGYTTTTVSAVMTTPSAFQPTTATSGGFLVKFNTSGVRLWGTYYDNTGPTTCAVNSSGDIYIAGTASNATTISTPGSHQASFGGGSYDGFIARFNTNGARLEGTYYGGLGNERPYACATNTLGNFYLAGYSDNTPGTLIASMGSHQPVYAGGTYDSFLAQFFACDNTPAAPVNITPAANQLVCAGKNATLAVVPNTGVTTRWYNSPIASATLFAGNSFVTPTLSAGTYTWYAEAFTCTNSATRTGITVTANPLPILNVAGVGPFICEGETITLNVSGASSYTWNTGETTTDITITPTITTTYSVSGTGANGCSNAAVITQSVNACVGISQSTGSMQLAVYPNPNDGEFVIETGKVLQVIITNTLGQVLLQKNLTAGKNNIDLSQYPKGIYFLSYIQEHATLVKLIRE